MIPQGFVLLTILAFVGVALVTADGSSMTAMPVSVDTTTPSPIMNRQGPRPFRDLGRIFRPLRCWMACRFGNVPADCKCQPRLENSCDQLKCADGKVCKMLLGRFPRCVKDKSVCEMTKDVGTCSEMVHRFYYNKTTNRCEEFHYGGCGGNGNNFKTKRACMRTCRKRGLFFPRP
ncbi:BPTI/Kunitz domain-containing protein 4-like [Haliotis asinina]|uniref:BPTI/Kunitz domain-containing protein 4-like n=1 Tax=Haliotis asinina TaxID=109174 RepID=UPI0035322381